ncbi:MAG: N-acetylmuramoyl-L-alanine amidase family protein [Eubacteriales bacterium]|jgi:N-acetylmuramoyl-L-alanine amidase
MAVEIEWSPVVQNQCYRNASSIWPVGIMVHSTATPGVMARRFAELWNTQYPGGRSVCVHAFVDDQVVCQTLPWTVKGWHSGRGSKGSANDMGYIGFEMCEPRDLRDAVYFARVWDNAVALCVRLCREYGLTEQDILCHSEGYQRGIASNHADVMHWFPLHGRTMEDFRAAVKAGLEDKETEMIYNYVDENMPQWAREAVQWAMDQGIVQGDGQGLALDDRDLRTITWLYRARQA